MYLFISFVSRVCSDAIIITADLSILLLFRRTKRVYAAECSLLTRRDVIKAYFRRREEEIESHFISTFLQISFPSVSLLLSVPFAFPDAEIPRGEKRGAFGAMKREIETGGKEG